MGKERVRLYQVRLKNIIEGITGAKIFALTGSQDTQIKEFNKVNNELAKNNTNSGFRNAIPRPLFELFILFIVFIFLIFLKDNTIYKDIIPTLGVFLTAAYRLAPSLGKILSNIQKFQYSIQSAEKLSIDKAKFDKFLDKSKNNQEIKFNSGIIVKNLSYFLKKILRMKKI